MFIWFPKYNYLNVIVSENNIVYLYRYMQIVYGDYKIV